jgi:hypothetical protein
MEEGVAEVAGGGVAEETCELDRKRIEQAQRPRRTARSASGASGMMRATGSPLACRIAKVTSETPATTTTSRTRRRTTNAVTGERRYFFGLAS